MKSNLNLKNFCTHPKMFQYEIIRNFTAFDFHITHKLFSTRYKTVFTHIRMKMPLTFSNIADDDC